MPKHKVAKLTAEQARMAENGDGRWWAWGPYLSERQWGTVREDYSPDGAAWDSFPHDHARSRAYRWGEDGIAGFSDREQLICLSLALWNGHDPILKERLFGLTNSEGNHGEDVKELYYYLDALPSHAYLRMLYKYPQREYPYTRLVEENARRSSEEDEFELLDTGIFDDDRYFDIEIEYAKASENDILMQITAHNRGPEAAPLHLLPQVIFRNTWSWDDGAPKPNLTRIGTAEIGVLHEEMGMYRVVSEGTPELLFAENESNARRLWGAGAEAHACPKDAFHEYVVGGNREAVSRDAEGTKAAFHHQVEIPAGESRQVRVRLTPGSDSPGFRDFGKIMETRRKEADAFYAELQAGLDEESRRIQRQAWAGLIWSKQRYGYDVRRWLMGDPTQPPPPRGRSEGRNADWEHLNSFEILSMPDAWEFPWFASWDLAFHCVPLARLDAAFAKLQLDVLTREWYLHPTGQLPAYEWSFSDVNPPVHAWAAWQVFTIDREQRGDAGDHAFLERVFHKLLLNFTWWVNRKDPDGHGIFEGGFLGLDNIGLFDRSAPLPTGGHLDQSDGTSWMAMYSLHLMRIALELAGQNPVYQDISTKFFEHFLMIAKAMTDLGGDGMGLWDEEDEFYYDVLHLPDGRHVDLKVRSMVGLIPLFAVEVLDQASLDRLPDFSLRLRWFLRHRPDLAKLVSRWEESGEGERRLLSLLRGHRMKRLLARMLDESEFLSPHGVRALSKVHRDHPYLFSGDGTTWKVDYEPGESRSNVFGGNSNWRGPIWFPVNFLIVQSLLEFHRYYGDDFQVECPTGSGTYLTIRDVAVTLSRRLISIFQPDEQGRRPVFGANAKLQSDPHFRDHILFHEYFHGDDGHGLGASHQTGWTALVAELIHLCGPREEGKP
ncbi:MAG: glucosidase [Gemmatimonadota bacterium]